MLMRIIAILSFLGAVAYGLLAKLAPAELWKCALAFALAFLALSALFVLCAAVVSLFIDKSWPRKKQNPLCRFFVRYGGELGCFYCGVRVHVSGTEKLPKDERFLLVANHRSLFDPLSIFHALGAYNIAFISKPSNLRIPVLGRLALGDCFLPIDRENDREALKSILCAADYLKRDLSRARAAGDRRRQRHRHGEEKRPAPLHGRVHRHPRAHPRRGGARPDDGGAVRSRVRRDRRGA